MVKKEVVNKIEELVENKISEIVENVKKKKKSKDGVSFEKGNKEHSKDDAKKVVTEEHSKKKVTEEHSKKKVNEEHGKKKVKEDHGKKKVNEDHPKKNKSAYNFYNMKQFGELKKEYPSYTSAEIMTKIASEWKELSDLDKEYYKNLALDDAERYKKEMENYTCTEKKIKGPKRNLSGFNFYCKNILPKLKSEYKDLSQKDLMIKVGENWKSLEDKSEYEELAKKDQERYAKELLEFKN